MTDRPMRGQANTSLPDEGKSELRSDAQETGDLQMSRTQMLDLGQKALELVVERMENLPGENAWKASSGRFSKTSCWRMRPKTAGLPRR